MSRARLRRSARVGSIHVFGGVSQCASRLAYGPCSTCPQSPRILASEARRIGLDPATRVESGSPAGGPRPGDPHQAQGERQPASKERHVEEQLDENQSVHVEPDVHV